MLAVPQPPAGQPNRNAAGTQYSSQPPETHNALERHPELPEGPTQLVVGEGTYVFVDQIKLNVPPPHPTESALPTNNPLAANNNPPGVGTRLSLTILAPRQPSRSQVYQRSNASGFNVSRDNLRGYGAAKRSVSFSQNLWGSSFSYAPPFGEGNAALVAPAGRENKDPNKRRKPKSSITKSNSSFLSRVITHDSINKRVQEHKPEGIYVFANIHRSIQWLDLSSASRAEYMTKILFTKAHPTGQDVNTLTKSANHLDIAIGFSSSDILWYEPISQKYSRLNKNGAINATPISGIRWVPGSENLMLASYADGSLIVFDKEKEDAPFPAEEYEGSSDKSSTEAKRRPVLHVKKSVFSKNQKTNPVSYWKASNHRVNAFAFSPDARHLAVVSEDGTLRIIDYLQERLLDVYISYYGGMTCVCWSPDGKYIVTGGQDDLVSIWSLADSTLVARCQGHGSWITAVAFDPWRCDERNYRFGSVGEDCRLLLWDFSVGMLHRPRAASIYQRGSVSTLAFRNRSGSQSTLLRLASHSNLSLRGPQGEEDDVTTHPVEPRATTAMLPPVMSKIVDEDPLTWLAFEEDCIMTSCSEGHIRTYERPREEDDERGGLY